MSVADGECINSQPRNNICHPFAMQLGMLLKDNANDTLQIQCSSYAVLTIRRPGLAEKNSKRNIINYETGNYQIQGSYHH